jgi:ATP-dependent DNA ligase
MLSVPLKFVRPCIPASRKSVPAGSGWLHEPKVDGYRLQVIKGRPPGAPL